MGEDVCLANGDEGALPVPTGANVFLFGAGEELQGDEPAGWSGSFGYDE